MNHMNHETMDEREIEGAPDDYIMEVLSDATNQAAVDITEQNAG